MWRNIEKSKKNIFSTIFPDCTMIIFDNETNGLGSSAKIIQFSGVKYRINKDFLYERKVEKLPNYIWELFEEKDNKIIKSKDFDIPIEIAPSGQMKFKTKQEVTVGTKIDFFDERIDNDTDRYMAWNIMNYRQDLKFIIFTFNKNYKKFLPDNWNNGYQNIKINILES